MMTGTVTPQHDALISVDLLSPDQRRERVEVLIDTGFNGHVIVPAAVIQRLALPFAGHRRATLGDGRVVLFEVYLASIWWHEHVQEIMVLQAEGGSLLGMALLVGNRVTLEVIANGAVSIEPLPSEAQG